MNSKSQALEFKVRGSLFKVTEEEKARSTVVLCSLIGVSRSERAECWPTEHSEERILDEMHKARRESSSLRGRKVGQSSLRSTSSCRKGRRSRCLCLLTVPGQGCGTGSWKRPRRNWRTIEFATFRYQFAYMEKGIKRPDSEAVLTATVRAAVAAARKHGDGLPLFAGGKSMGGRMTSLAAAKEPLEGVRGLIYFGFPLHAAGKPSVNRGEHLFDVKLPMLFLQGSRDALADLKLLKPLCARLGKRVELFIIDGGDHSFHLLKSSGRSDDQALDEAVAKTSSWISRLSR